MYHQWRDFDRFLENGSEPPFTLDCAPLTGRKGFFATLLNALQESRRLQAQRVLRQNRHLITKERVIDAPVRSGGCAPQGNSAMEKFNAPRAQRPSAPLKLWIIVTAIGFCILHVVGGLLLGAPNTRSTETSLASMRGD